MSRRCPITGKGVQSGNNVSHANNKSRRRFMPNMQKTSVYSDLLKTWFSLRLTPHGMRTIEHRGGIDAYVQSVAITKLPAILRPLRKRVDAAKVS
jgi:large subunit ribosomal protein L28